MGLCLLGMFAFNVQGIEGSLLMMVAHGIVSPGLFLCIGILYDRYKTRVILYYGGLAQTMPILATSMLILTMANISLPILSPSFAAEFLIFTGIFLVNRLVALIAITTMVLTAAYSLFLFSRVFFGNLKTVYISKFSDINRREFFCLFPFLAFSILLGVFPALVLDTCHVSIAYILVSYNWAWLAFAFAGTFCFCANKCIAFAFAGTFVDTKAPAKAVPPHSFCFCANFYF